MEAKVIFTNNKKKNKCLKLLNNKELNKTKNIFLIGAWVPNCNRNIRNWDSFN